MKKKAMAEAVQTLIKHRNSCRCYDLTFYDIPTELKPKTQGQLKADFELWWDSWIAPELALLEKELK